MTDVVYPALIVVACIMIAFLVHRLTRPVPSRADLALPTRTQRAGGSDHRVALANWHLEYGDALLDFIDRADRTTAGGNGSDAADATDDVLAKATEEHPFAEMRAELGAMRAAVDAAAAAHGRADLSSAAGHQRVYVAYRQAWLERVWQFPGDAARITELRRRPVDPVPEPTEEPAEPSA